MSFDPWTGQDSNYINGMRVVLDSEMTITPNMKCTAKFAKMFPELAAETNAWMADFFGAKYHAYRLGNDTLIMHPTQFEQFRKYLAAKGGTP